MPFLLNPKNSPVILASNGVPVGSAPSGTVGPNGALTLGTALLITYDHGAFVYYPAGAVYALSAAAFYWTVFTTTLAGIIYNNIFNPLTDLIPEVPTTLVPIVGAGPGAFVGDTSNKLAAVVQVPAAFQGENGSLEIEFLSSQASNANSKTACAFHSSDAVNVVVGLLNSTNANGTRSSRRLLQNAGSSRHQTLLPALLNDPTTSSNASVSRAYDFSSDSEIRFYIGNAVATDFSFIEWFKITSSYGA